MDKEAYIYIIVISIVVLVLGFTISYKLGDK